MIRATERQLPLPDQPLQAAMELSALASSSTGLLVADIHGSVHVLNRDFEPIRSWIAHVGGRVTHMVERKGVLITLGVCHGESFRENNHLCSLLG